ncbi:UDP-N-acetylmuramoyl-L-alanine--D-glutamate ligase, partial [Aliarcobacter butzleri]
MNENDIAIIPYQFEDLKTKAVVITYYDSDDLCEFFNIDKSKIIFKEPFLLDSILSLCTSKKIYDEINYYLIKE